MAECERRKAPESGLRSGLEREKNFPNKFFLRGSLLLNWFTGKELDEETGFYYYGARYLNPKTSMWISADPAMGDYIPSAPVNEEARKRNGNLPGMGGVFNYVNFHVYHYAGNNPIKYIDPDGRLDYIYTAGETFTTENDWGFWEFLHFDRYFVEMEDGTRIQANSEETVTLDKTWSKVDMNFLTETMPDLIDDANKKPTDFIRVLKESLGGELDFKERMDSDTLYLAGGVLYNNHEAGNFVWTYFLESQGYGGLLPGILAQAGSLLGFLFSDNYKFPRLDEWHDVKARYAGQRYYHSQKGN
jgi:hypothetical protein